MMGRMKFWFRLAVLSSCVMSCLAQAAEPAKDKIVPQSALDGMLFYQLLLGEMNVREGSPGTGFSMVLDAARKTRDPALFQRAIDIALQSRSGEAALQAAQTWKREIPGAQEPNRYILQIQLALNRIPEAGQALATSLNELPVDEQIGAIISIPRVFARVHDKVQAAQVVEKALSQFLNRPALAATAWTTIGRMHRDADQLAQAVDAALKGHAADKSAQGPLILALSLLSKDTPPLKAMLDEAMQSPVAGELRLAYARTLIGQRAYGDALRQLQTLTQRHPEVAQGWLMLGLMQQDMGQALQAEQLLIRFLDVSKNTQEPELEAGRAEALLALSQMAQQKGQIERASQWLSQIPANVDPIRLGSRRAELLAQQGRMDEARLVLSQIKTTTPDQSRRKALVLAQWLREHKQHAAAHEVIQQALTEQPDSQELLTELSLIAEKLQRYDEMETVLRGLMKSYPQDPHAYNALGYSLADRKLRLQEAQQLIAKAVELAPEDPYIQDSLGWVEFRLGHTQEALRILQAAYKAKPDAEIAAHLGEVLWSLGRQQEAGTLWREGLLLKPDNETLVETIRRFQFKP
ncbi:tetratricopeptide repeat protein [Limnohabitans sp. JUR4]|uniref:Tetratricopeptide repeat protein n=2 Tax=Limnohabitans radicicola TaxID=2771427 RepID=A0A927FDF5_9BURK|nr:tetratricopeptide repeat protein [Limnohabitans radicicola]